MKKKHTEHRKNVRAARHNLKPSQSVLSINRTIIIFSSLVLLVAIPFAFNRNQLKQSVEGASIFRPLFGKATVSLPGITGAVYYNVYYKSTTDVSFIHAVRNIPTNVTQYTISFLKKGVSYQYKIAAVSSRGNEFWFSEIKPITNIQSL